jgi:hypothetical protein
MPQIIRPTTIVKQFTTQTVQGEVTINLNLVLTIHTDANGVISVDATPVPVKEIAEYVPQIPDIAVEDLIDFGKDV